MARKRVVDSTDRIAITFSEFCRQYPLDNTLKFWRGCLDVTPGEKAKIKRELNLLNLREVAGCFVFMLKSLSWENIIKVLALGLCVMEHPSCGNNEIESVFFNVASIFGTVPSEKRFNEHVTDIACKERTFKRELKDANKRKETIGRLFKKNFIEGRWFQIEISKSGQATNKALHENLLFMVTMLSVYYPLLPKINNQTCSLPRTECELQML